MCMLSRDLLTSLRIPAVIFVFSTTNAWQTIDRLVTGDLQPLASADFCDLAREVENCKFHLQIMFSL